jgi:hypothetical protein
MNEPFAETIVAMIAALTLLPLDEREEKEDEGVEVRS